ncbi:hypothetical protein SDC9_39442 [bioreactor metagenome]|uniref:Uncharacterized protein n=1 Tax=bioreactor metagenome TaxID=1076179 RepID=A0A644VPP3_9ZZZZ
MAVMAGGGKRIGDIAPDHRDLLDDLRQPLTEQHREADQQQRLRRPQDQTAGVGRDLARDIGAHHVGVEQVEHQRDHRHQEEDVAEQVDPVLHTTRPGAVENVDADMLVLLQRIGGGEQEGRAIEIPLQLEPGIRRYVEDLAHGRVDRADQNRDQDEPRHGFADDLVDTVDQTRKGQQSAHLILPFPVSAPKSGACGFLGRVLATGQEIWPIWSCFLTSLPRHAQSRPTRGAVNIILREREAGRKIRQADRGIFAPPSAAGACPTMRRAPEFPVFPARHLLHRISDPPPPREHRLAGGADAGARSGAGRPETGAEAQGAMVAARLPGR